MTDNTEKSKIVPIKFNAEDLATVDWLKMKTKRTRAGAVKWAVAEKAEELGYIAPKPKKKR